MKLDITIDTDKIKSALKLHPTIAFLIGVGLTIAATLGLWAGFVVATLAIGRLAGTDASGWFTLLVCFIAAVLTVILTACVYSDMKIGKKP